MPSSILGSLTQEFKDNSSAEGKNLDVPPDKLLTKLSFTHFTQLIKIDDPLKRTFYEIECIKGTWSVRELKRQVASLYYERSGLSAKPEKLAEIVCQKTKPQNPPDIILVNSNPEDIANLILFGKATYRKMVQNLVWATGYNALAIPLAAGVLSFAGFVLDPAVGAVLMSLSTIIVAINAQLLKKSLNKS